MKMKFLKYCDFLGTKFHFYVGGNPNDNSIFGGIMSIIFFIITIIIFILLSYDDLHKLNPITEESEVPGGEIKIVNFHEQKIWIPWRIVTYEEVFVDHRGILHPVISFIEGKWDSTFGMNLTYHTLNYKLCNETSMANKSEAYKIPIPLNEIFCIDNDDIPWGGSWHGDIVYYVEVNLFLCEEGVDFDSNDPRCTKTNELLKHRNTSWLFEFFYPVIQFEPTNYNMPISVLYRSYMYRLSSYANKVERLYMRENIMDDDKSLIGSNNEKTSFWGMSNIYGDTYFTPPEKDLLVKSTSSRIYSLVIYMDQGYALFKRRYKNIFYIFSEVLPLVNLVLFIFKKTTHFIKSTFAKKQLTELIFENIKITNNLNSKIKENKSKIQYEERPPLIKGKSKVFLDLNKNSKINFSSAVNLNKNLISNYSHNFNENDKSNNKLKLISYTNENDSNSYNKNIPSDVNMIKLLNTNLLKKKSFDDQNYHNNFETYMDKVYIANGKRKIISKYKKEELFPIIYFYMNICFDRLIKPKSFLCFNKKYFIIYNFMNQIFDVSSHILLLKYFLIFKDSLINEVISRRDIYKKININDEKKLKEIEKIIDKNENLYITSIF